MTRIKDHEKWMKLAFCEAEKAFDQDEIPIGAVVVQNRQIIGKFLINFLNFTSEELFSVEL